MDGGLVLLFCRKVLSWIVCCAGVAYSKERAFIIGGTPDCQGKVAYFDVHEYFPGGNCWVQVRVLLWVLCSLCAAF